MSVGSELRVARPAVTSGLRTDAVAEWALFAMLAFGILSPLLTGDVSRVSGESHGSGGQGNLLRQGVYVIVFGLALLAAEVVRFPARLWALPASVLAMLAWCCLSLTWAIDPGVGARRLLLTIIVTFTVFLLVPRAGYERTVAVVRRILPAILVANYAAVALVPGFAIHHASTVIDPGLAGAWRGILMQKNFTGLVCAYTVIFFALDAGRLRWPLRLAVVLGGAFFLYQTHSKTSLGFTVASILVALTFTRYNAYYRAVAVTFACLGVALLALAAYLGWGALSALFDDGTFLTGRATIWPILLEFWREHPVTGSGYGSFWDVSDPQPILGYATGYRAWVADLTSGHNGYVDLLVQTGLPGLVLAVCATIVGPLWRFLTSLTLDRSRGGLLVACTLFSICHNLTESSVFSRDEPVNVFLMLAIALLHLESRPRGARLTPDVSARA